MISIASTTAQGPNLYPHTRYHRGFPQPMARETMVSMACSLPEQTGPFDLGVEDLETIAASLLLAWRPLDAVVLAQAELIAEAYRHDMGLDPWRPGRRGILGQSVRGIARLITDDSQPLMTRKAYLYRWLRGHPVPLDDWQPEPVIAMSGAYVTYVRGELWQGWEFTPIAVNHRGEVGAHPGAWSARISRWRLRIKPSDSPETMIKKVLDASSI